MFLQQEERKVHNRSN